MPTLLGWVLLLVILFANIVPIIVFGIKYRRMTRILRDYSRQYSLWIDEKQDVAAPRGARNLDMSVGAIRKGRGATLAIQRTFVAGGSGFVGWPLVWLSVSVKLDNPGGQAFVFNKRRLFNFVANPHGLPRYPSTNEEINHRFEFRSNLSPQVREPLGDSTLLFQILTEMDPGQFECWEDQLTYASANFRGDVDTLAYLIDLMCDVAHQIERTNRLQRSEDQSRQPVP